MQLVKPPVDPEALARAEYVQGLRDLADFVEQGSKLRLPSRGVTIDVFTFDEDDYAAQGETLPRPVDRVLTSSFAITRRRFGPHRIDVNLGLSRLLPDVPGHTREAS